MKEFLTAQDIADILQISYVNSLNFIKYSGIQYIKIGNQYRVTKMAFDKFINVKSNVIVKFE